MPIIIICMLNRDVEAEAESGHISMQAEARKISRFRFCIIQKNIL